MEVRLSNLTSLSVERDTVTDKNKEAESKIKKKKNQTDTCWVKTSLLSIIICNSS